MNFARPDQSVTQRVTAIRINKYICESGICSRKAANSHVRGGVVLNNGKQATLGDKVSEGDSVTVNGQAVVPLTPDQVILLVLNKPVGIVCTAAGTDQRNIIDFVAHGSRVFPVGRLDKDSQGLIFLTNRCDLMCKHFHYCVLKLERIRIMHVELNGLPLGQWRNLTEVALAVLLRL